MAELREVMAYFCSKYPRKTELSKARLTKMVYLADWRSAIEHGQQITRIEWVYNHYGPYVDDVADIARDDPAFSVVLTANVYGGQKAVIRYLGVEDWPSLSASDRRVLDYVIAKTAPMFWNDFIELVYSTHPIATQPQYARLDLVALASEYAMAPGERAAGVALVPELGRAGER